MGKLGVHEKLDFWNPYCNWGGFAIGDLDWPQVSYFLSHQITKSLSFMISGKLECQSTRNSPQNQPYSPGSIQDTFIIYASISHQHIIKKCFTKTLNKHDNRTYGNLKIQKPRFTNKCPVCNAWLSGLSGLPKPWRVGEEGTQPTNEFVWTHFILTPGACEGGMRDTIGWIRWIRGWIPKNFLLMAA